MSRVEPMEVIENPLANEESIVLERQPLTGDPRPNKYKRHSGAPEKSTDNYPLLVTTVNDERSKFGGGIHQSKSHQIIGQNKKASQGGGTREQVRRLRSSEDLPTDPLLNPATSGGGGGGGASGGEPPERRLQGDPSSSTAKPEGHKLEDDGYSSSFTSKTSEVRKKEGETPTGSISGEPPRETWSQGMDFLLSIIGFAVDLANVWRFPYYCYKNGGGAFLIPYFLMLVLSAIPVFYMELLLGQSIRQGPISVWKICPLFKGIGYCAVTVSYFVSFYYNTIMSWSLHYTLNSFISPLPWTTCNNSWNTDDCYVPDLANNVTRPINATSPASEYFRYSVLDMRDHSIDNLGLPKWDLLLCLAAVYCLLYLILFRGIRSTGKVVWVTATLPYGVMAILLVRGLFEEGAAKGIYYYLVPDVSKLAKVEVWSDAAKQIFFSSGAGFGVHLTYASYNSYNNNCYRDCLITSFVNCLTSIFAGFVIFVYLGAMAERQGRDVSDVVNVGPGLVFEVYPEAVGYLPGANFWSILFFIMLIMLGIDSAMGGLECVITGLMDEFKTVFKFTKRSRSWFMFICVLISFFVSIINVTRGGIFVFTFLDTYAAGSSLLLAVFFEVLVVAWVYGLDQIGSDAKAMIGHAPGMYWKICWKFVSPALIAVVIIMDFVNSSPLTYDNYNYPEWVQTFGVIFTLLPITLVPAIALTELYKYPGSWKNKLAHTITPESEHSAIKEHKIVRRFHRPHWLYL